MTEVDGMLKEMEEARLGGNTQALTYLGAQLAQQLGVCEAGGDAYGLWLRFEVQGTDGAVASQRMRWVWPGRFLMGAPDNEERRNDTEGPVHEVVLTAGFWIGDTPVTQALYRAVTGDCPSNLPDTDRPVEQVSWEQAVAFCERLCATVPALTPRLPTEAQWEYAARAGTTSARYGDPSDIAWYEDNSDVEGSGPGTQPVAQKRPNAWGLYDVLGNVDEWCEDRTELEPYDACTQYDPLGTEGSLRVAPGNSCCVGAEGLRAAFRYANDPDHSNDDLGFRLAAVQR